MVIAQRTFAIALTKGVLNIVLPNLVWQRGAQPVQSIALQGMQSYALQRASASANAINVLL